MADDPNLYGYCGQNPVNFIDPTGHFSIGLKSGWGLVGATLNAAAMLTGNEKLSTLSSVISLFVAVYDKYFKPQQAESIAEKASNNAPINSSVAEENNNQNGNQVTGDGNLGDGEIANIIQVSFKDFLGSQVDEIQKVIDSIEAKVKNGQELTAQDINFMLWVYNKIIVGGKLFGFPEASKLLARYFAPSSGLGRYFNRSGRDPDDPFMINSEVYEKSVIVQYAMDQMKSRITYGVLEDKFEQFMNIDSRILRTTPTRNQSTEGTILRDGYLLAEQNNRRLHYTDNRFRLNASSIMLENGSIKTTWSVQSIWDFARYPSTDFTRFPAFGYSITIDDGLSAHLADIGVAEVFYYKAEWVEIWNPIDYTH